MQLAVQACMDQNTEKWNNVPVIAQIKNQLDEIIQRIETQSNKTAVDSKATTQNKNQIRGILTQKALILAGTLSSYGAITDNLQLAEETKLSKSEIDSLKEAEIEAIINNLIQQATDKLDQLADFGISAEQITDLSTSLDDFTAMIGKPRVIRNQKFAAMQQIDELIDEARKLLKTKLDRIMIRYRYADPEFYDSYQRSRSIVDM